MGNPLVKPEVGGFTFYLLLIIAAMYLVTYTAIIREWRKNR